MAKIKNDSTFADGTNIRELIDSKSNAEMVNGYKVWTGTQAEYDAIETKSANTIYFIIAEESE